MRGSARPASAPARLRASLLLVARASAYRHHRRSLAQQPGRRTLFARLAHIARDAGGLGAPPSRLPRFRGVCRGFALLAMARDERNAVAEPLIEEPAQQHGGA